MTLSLQQQLREKFVGLTKEMPHEFRIEDGWYGILKSAMEELHAIRMTWNKPRKERTRILTVSKKSGRLKIYMTKASPEMKQIIEELEKASDRTCEVCGKAGLRRTKEVVACGEHWTL